MRIALHKHPGIHGVVEAAEEILRAVPGIELVDLHQPRAGLDGNDMQRAAGLSPRNCSRPSFDAAEAAGIDALVAIYHSDHRELCAHERDWPFRIMNMLRDRRRQHGPARRRPLQAAEDDAGRRCHPCRLQRSGEPHGLDVETTRRAIKSMLAEQPLPLRGA